jgi:hypothetical protein
MTEKELYIHVVDWLSDYLTSHYKRAKIIVKDTHRISLSNFLTKIGMHNEFSEFSAYDIKVDVTGIIKYPQKTYLVFVECKTKPIRLLDVGQLLGYSLVAKPILSFLISPNGVSEPLYKLLKVYGRYDILQYDKELVLKIVTWDKEKKEPTWNSLIPSGEYLTNNAVL